MAITLLGPRWSPVQIRPPRPTQFAAEESVTARHAVASYRAPCADLPADLPKSLGGQLARRRKAALDACVASLPRQVREDRWRVALRGAPPLRRLARRSRTVLMF